MDTIDVATFRQLQKDPMVRVLDVRSGGEFESAHIPGSYNVPLDTLVEHVGEFVLVEDPVVLVCQSGSRASQARERLAAEGKSTLHILDGGMNAWIAERGELTSSGKQRWALDRQVRLGAGTVAITSVLASRFFPPAKWIAAGVGAGLFYMAVTDTCPVSPLVSKLPYNQAAPCDIDAVLDALNTKAA
jgi:rhodanese-related sulfurtransferase